MDRLTVTDLLAELERRTPGSTDLLAGSPEREIRAVWLAEDLREVGDGPAAALVLLGRAASRDAQGYKLDVAMRRLGDVAGIVLQSEAPRPSPSAVAMARREDLPLIRLTAPIDVTALLTSIVRMLDAGLPTLLERAERMSAAVDRLEPDRWQPADLLRRAGATDLGIRLGPRDERQHGIPADLTDPAGAWLQRAPTLAAEDALVQLTMWRLAAAITARSIETDRHEQLSLLSVGELLTELLDAAADSALVRRAADLGIHVEGWNQVVVLEYTDHAELARDDAVAAFRYVQAVSQVVARSAVQQEGSWTTAPRAGGALLLRTRSHPEGPAGLRRLRAALQAVLDRAVESFPGARILCGVGGIHEGLQGLQFSRAEADSAIQSARLRGAVNEPVLFDAPGLSRLLVEWYASSSVRQSIDDLLAPLAELGTAKQQEYSTTLRVYLENNRSISRTSKQLYLHRNTVTYRINKVLGVLAVDLDDPPQYLATYLACYAHAMQAAR